MGWRDAVAVLWFAAMVIGLWIWAKRDDRRKGEKLEQALIDRLPRDRWRMIFGGERLINQDFAGHFVLQRSTLLFPLAVGNEDGKQFWVFRYNRVGRHADECVGAAMAVVKCPNWRLPALSLVTRRSRLWASRQPIRDLGVESPELIECWTVDEGPLPDHLEAARELVAALLPTMQRSEPLRRVDFNGNFLACVGDAGYSVDAFLAILSTARSLSRLADELSTER